MYLFQKEDIYFRNLLQELLYIVDFIVKIKEERRKIKEKILWGREVATLLWVDLKEGKWHSESPKKKVIADSFDQVCMRKVAAWLWITISNIIIALTIIAPMRLRKFSQLPRPTHLESCRTGFNPSPSDSTDCALFNKHLIIANLSEGRLQAYYSASIETVLSFFMILFSNLMFILLNYALQKWIKCFQSVISKSPSCW